MIQGRPFKMKTASTWLVATIIFIAIMAVVGNIEVFLEKQFPNP